MYENLYLISAASENEREWLRVSCNSRFPSFEPSFEMVGAVIIPAHMRASQKKQNRLPRLGDSKHLIEKVFMRCLTCIPRVLL